MQIASRIGLINYIDKSEGGGGRGGGGGGDEDEPKNFPKTVPT